MAKYFEINLLCIIISSFLVALSVSKPSELHDEYPITSCLTKNHVTNFSIIPSTTYYHFLNFSLQNLIFTGPNIPKPFVMILPESKEQLVSSLLCSRDASYEIRVRCGGHSYEGLSWVGDSPFVIIDLMNLNKVEVDLDSKTAWVEGGAVLGEVYYAIADKSKGSYGFSAGACHTVGSGGHISGGGFGYLSQKYGLAADNVVDALLIGPDGRVMDRTGMGEDVFWALRGGGGGSFGIVYKWKIKLLEVPPIVTVFKALRNGTVDNMSQLVHRWQYVGPYLDHDFHLNIYIRVNASDDAFREGSYISAMFNGMYQGQKNVAVSIVDKMFPELKISENDCIEMSWIEAARYFSHLPKGSRINDLKNRYLQGKYYYKVKSDYVKKPISLDGVRGALQILADEPKGLIWWEPYGAKMAEIASDTIPFPHREGNLFNIHYSVQWISEEDDKNRDRYLAWIRKFYDFMTPYVSSNPRAAYINFIDLDLGEDWGHQYFLNNYERLVKAKTIIDPCNVFRHPQGIAPNPSYSKKHCLKSYFGKWNSRAVGGRKNAIAVE